MQTKSIWLSKINWAAIIIALLSILPEIQHLIENTNFNGMSIVNIVLFTISILIIIFRSLGKNPPVTEIAAKKQDSLNR